MGLPLGVRMGSGETIMYGFGDESKREVMMNPGEKPELVSARVVVDSMSSKLEVNEQYR